jgi:hypothetical protein
MSFMGITAPNGQMVGIEVLSVSVRGNGAYGKAPAHSAAAAE